MKAALFAAMALLFVIAASIIEHAETGPATLSAFVPIIAGLACLWGATRK